MTKWEYKICWEPTKPASLHNLENELDELGLLGWKVIKIMRAFYECEIHVVYLRRKINA